MTPTNVPLAAAFGVVVWLAAFASAGGSAAADDGPAAPSGASAAQPEAIVLEEQILELRTTRDDITVGRAVIAVYCAEPTALRIQESVPTSTWTLLALEPAGPHQFRLPVIRVERTSDAAGPVYLSLKAWFAEVSNQDDALYYAHLDDRYALVSFCSGSEDATDGTAKARFRQNRLPTLNALCERLREPFVIRLNDRPLPAPEGVR